MGKGDDIKFEEPGKDCQFDSYGTSSEPTLRAGSRVELFGLNGAAHLNGTLGACDSFDASTGRWVVRLDGTGELKSLKLDNLVVAPTEASDEVDEADSDSDDGNSGRMASDPESGFFCCRSGMDARQASSDGEKRLEFIGISSRSELNSSFDLIEELLMGPRSAERPLRGLSFADSKLEACDMARLAAALKSEAGQKMNAFGISKSPGLPADCWKELFMCLPSKPLWLDFGDNGLTDEVLSPLIDILDGQEDLDKLYLDGNRLQDISALCRILPDTGVTNLDLGDNSIDDIGPLIPALQKSVILILVLGTNPITVQGACDIFKALPRTTLDVLYLNETCVDDTSLLVLAASLADASLSELHIDSTKISDSGVREFISCIEASQITYVDISGNGISDETTQLLSDALAKDRRVGDENSIPEGEEEEQADGTDRDAEGVRQGQASAIGSGGCKSGKGSGKSSKGSGIGSGQGAEGGYAS